MFSLVKYVTPAWIQYIVATVTNVTWTRDAQQPRRSVAGVAGGYGEWRICKFVKFHLNDPLSCGRSTAALVVYWSSISGTAQWPYTDMSVSTARVLWAQSAATRRINFLKPAKLMNDNKLTYSNINFSFARSEMFV